jgi:hypothetical protein
MDDVIVVVDGLRCGGGGPISLSLSLTVVVRKDGVVVRRAS